ncbi:MAG: hypothetical protein KF726_10630 [Anaerolineae bacterium]|nr:hypothetical protein [Anaerolineae bacterium]
MSTELAICPECGASWQDGLTCQDYFYQMLYWENEYPGHGVVHHLLVLCYHLQHPRLYSAEIMPGVLKMLYDFVEGGVSPQEMRRSMRARVDSGKRDFKITARADSQGSYSHPVHWTMRAGDVVARGADEYIASVNLWARSMLDALRKSGNLPANISAG